jgi:hypothetical protein
VCSSGVRLVSCYGHGWYLVTVTVGILLRSRLVSCYGHGWYLVTITVGILLRSRLVSCYGHGWYLVTVTVGILLRSRLYRCGSLLLYGDELGWTVAVVPMYGGEVSSVFCLNVVIACWRVVVMLVVFIVGSNIYALYGFAGYHQNCRC